MQLSLIDARVSPIDRTWLTNVYPLYLHDLSEFDDGLYHLNEQGLWEPDFLPYWLGAGTHWPLLLVAESQRVGFALIMQAPSAFMQSGREYLLGEFFVLRNLRRTGIGRTAVEIVFARFPGLWELSVLQRNTGALAFWRRLLSSCSKEPYSEQPVNTTVSFSFCT
ncbi:MAG: GNAT family N-acetyltransferase [Deltaproteobacteria bacterium]|nr:GNAT family N-acetyltransferase [Deltaproteobacteria bacterium]